MNEYISSLQEDSIRTLQEWNDYVSKDNQDQIKKIILIRLGMDHRIIENRRAFEKISKKMDIQLINIGLKNSKASVLRTSEIDKIITALCARGWRSSTDGSFTILANSNGFLNGKRKIQRKKVITEYRKETRISVDDNSRNYITFDNLTVARVRPGREDESIIVGNTRTGIDRRGVEVQKIESRAMYNSQNTFNLKDYFNPTEKSIMSFVEQIIKDGKEPIKSYNGYLTGRCLIFNRYDGENQGAGRIEYHCTENDNTRTHTKPQSIDLTRMESDIATLDNISRGNLEELEEYVYDPYDKRGKRFRMRRLDTKIEESKILGSMYKDER